MEPKMRSLLLILSDIHNCLKILCEVESDLLDSSFMGLFRKKDYLGNETKLFIVKEKLEELSSELSSYTSSKQIAMNIALDAAHYLRALYETGAELSKLNANLQKKALGESYSMSQYNQDLSNFKKCQDRYMSAGDILNAKYRLYAGELS